LDDRFKEIVLDELSVFYVGITRARQQAYISASAINANGYSSIVSCLANIAGIKLVKADTVATT
jgi:DNA helicase-2/ATP-dependent DNA helicase PcrA